MVTRKVHVAYPLHRKAFYFIIYIKIACDHYLAVLYLKLFMCPTLCLLIRPSSTLVGRRILSCRAFKIILLYEHPNSLLGGGKTSFFKKTHLGGHKMSSSFEPTSRLVELRYLNARPGQSNLFHFMAETYHALDSNNYETSDV